MPHTYGRAALSLVCAEHWRDFAALEYSGYICPEYGGEIMIIVPLAEAKNNLSKLVDDAAAGQVITIAKHGRALARLVPMGKSNGQRIGAMKGNWCYPKISTPHYLTTCSILSKARSHEDSAGHAHSALDAQ